MKPSPLPHVLFVLYLIVAILAMVWPGMQWAGQRTEPFVLGLPFAFAWNIGWIAGTFLALCLYHAAVRRRWEP